MSSVLNITRRDFINGIALGAAASGVANPLESFAAIAVSADYPPLRTGLRGSHAGSFEVAHAVAWSGKQYVRPAGLTDSIYDLVVVGGGISGLTAALLFRQRAGKAARILVIDNHDDFGGHAKRNEFQVDGTTLIGYGGSQSMDGPARYSANSKSVLSELGIDAQRFYQYFDQKFMADRDLKSAIYFRPDTYGKSTAALNIFRHREHLTLAQIQATIAQYPLAPESQAALVRLLTDETDHQPQLSRRQKIDFLRSLSYASYLRDHVRVPQDVIDLLDGSVLDLWGVAWDALSALEAYRAGMPATQHLGIGELDDEHENSEPYIFHFPDGNAGIARALVRKLCPGVLPGNTMEDLVTARADYSRLDQSGTSCRMRLNSTAVDIRHTEDQKHVDVTYVRSGEVCRVRGRHVIFAGYNAMLPHICSEVPELQRHALEYAEKVPLVYMTLALRNWRAFEKLGYHSFYVPNAKYLHSFGLDFPVSMGAYKYPTRSDQPIVVHGSWIPHVPSSGLPARQQHVAGRRQLYETTFEQFESDIVSVLSGALGGGGFVAERDLAAITVNRWPHGYAYEYNDLSDPVGFSPDNGPHVAGRAQIGRISIANSDSHAYAYANSAIDSADRAVGEQMRAW